MSFRGIQCPVCHHTFEDGDDVVVCPECGTPHHRDCWNASGHCANAEKHGTPFEFPHAEEPEKEPPKEPSRPSFGAYRRPIRCPDCGAENEPMSDRCSVCGARLRRSTDNARPYDFDPRKLNTDIVPPNVMVDGIPAEESAAFIGPNCTRYVFNFMQMERNDAKIGWNWCAALFGPLWCFYRKLYKVGLVYILLSLLVSIITLPSGYGAFMTDLIRNTAQFSDPSTLYEYIMENAPVTSAWQDILSFVFRTGSMLVLGFFGDTFYKRKTKASILACRRKATNMPDYISLLHQKGGVSLLMLILCLILLVPVQNLIVTGIAMLL